MLYVILTRTLVEELKHVMFVFAASKLAHCEVLSRTKVVWLINPKSLQVFSARYAASEELVTTCY